MRHRPGPHRPSFIMGKEYKVTNYSNIREQLNETPEESLSSYHHWVPQTKIFLQFSFSYPNQGSVYPPLPLGLRQNQHHPSAPRHESRLPLLLSSPSSVLDPIETDSNPSSSYCSKDGVLWSRDACQCQNWSLTLSIQADRSFLQR